MSTGERVLFQTKVPDSLKKIFFMPIIAAKDKIMAPIDDKTLIQPYLNLGMISAERIPKVIQIKTNKIKLLGTEKYDQSKKAAPSPANIIEEKVR